MHTAQGKHTPFPKDGGKEKDSPQHPGAVVAVKPQPGQGPGLMLPLRIQPRTASAPRVTHRSFHGIFHEEDPRFCSEMPSPPEGMGPVLEAGGGVQAPLPEKAEKWLGVGKRS